MKKIEDYVKAAGETILEERRKDKGAKPVSYRERRSLQMSCVWQGIANAERDGVVIESLGPAIRAGWDFVHRIATPSRE